MFSSTCPCGLARVGCLAALNGAINPLAALQVLKVVINEVQIVMK
jgi:hypothetical protein